MSPEDRALYADEQAAFDEADRIIERMRNCHVMPNPRSDDETKRTGDARAVLARALKEHRANLRRAEGERDEMRSARDVLLAEVGRLRARLADVEARAEGLDVTEHHGCAR